MIPHTNIDFAVLGICTLGKTSHARRDPNARHDPLNATGTKKRAWRSIVQYKVDLCDVGDRYTGTFKIDGIDNVPPASFNHIGIYLELRQPLYMIGQAAPGKTVEFSTFREHCEQTQYAGRQSLKTLPRKVGIQTSWGTIVQVQVQIHMYHFVH